MSSAWKRTRLECVRQDSRRAWQGGGGRQGRRGSHEARVAAAGVLGDKKSTPLIKVVAGWRAVFLLMRGRGVDGRSTACNYGGASLTSAGTFASRPPRASHRSFRRSPTRASGLCPEGSRGARAGLWALVDGSGGTASGSGQALRGPKGVQPEGGAAARAASDGASRGGGGEGAAGVSNRRRGGLGVQLAAA